MWSTANEPNICIPSTKAEKWRKKMAKYYGNQLIDDGIAYVRDCRYRSARSERSGGFCVTAKPEQVYFYGHKMPVIGEVHGLKRNPIKFRAVWVWNSDFTGGVIESAKLNGATKKDKVSHFVLGDIIGLVNDVVNLYKKEGE
nr:MAG TPA: hypothetical protein [Caudoviricetes sp.]